MKNQALSLLIEVKVKIKNVLKVYIYLSIQHYNYVTTSNISSFISSIYFVRLEHFFLLINYFE